MNPVNFFLRHPLVYVYLVPSGAFTACVAIFENFLDVISPNDIKETSKLIALHMHHQKSVMVALLTQFLSAKSYFPVIFESCQ